MRSSPWLSAMLSALAALGLITCRTTFANAQEQDDKKPTVIILKLQTSDLLGKEEVEKDKDNDKDDDNAKEMKEGDNDQGEEDDNESKSKKKKEKKPKEKKPQENKAVKKPKSKPDQPAEERRPEPQRDQPRRDRPDQNPPSSDRSNSDRRSPERSFQFRWEGEGPRLPRREEGRGGPPPDEFRRQVEQQRDRLNRQREELERHVNEMKAQADRMRREAAERAKQAEQSRDQRHQARQMAQGLAERLKTTEQQLEQRTQEVRKLKVALEEREKAIVELKQALAKQDEKQGDVVKPKQPQKVTDQKPIDPALIGRVERLEAEIRKLMGVLKLQSQPKPQPKVIEQPQLKDEEIKRETSKSEANVPNPGAIIISGNIYQRQADGSVLRLSKPSGQAKSEARIEKSPVAGIEQPMRIDVAPKDVKPEADGGALVMGNRSYLREAIVPTPPSPSVLSPDVPPPTPLPEPDPVAPAAVKPVGAITAASVGGVGIVEGDVVALLPQEGKFVLKVSTWHDGKQVRADWVGQQVSINQGNLPAVKPGDHIALDARIEGQKGLVWGGKVFQTK